MSNSALASYTKISPYCEARKGKISRITIHHMAGKLSVEQCGNVFQYAEASANYGIGYDGRVGLYVPENKRAWASASPYNDHKSINIELSNDSGKNWHVSDKVINSCIKLCADICTRNKIAKLNYTGDDSGNLTMHCWYASTACPGPYLKTKFAYIAAEVNKLLKARQSAANMQHKVVSAAYYVKVTATDLRIRAGAGTSYAVRGYIKPGVYTIVGKKNANGYTWGRLKSGAGWIAITGVKGVAML